MNETPSSDAMEKRRGDDDRPGERSRSTREDESHEGTFGEGQAESPPHPEETSSGDFARGMRHGDDEEDLSDESSDEDAA